ncbi:MAG TPA: hypothetical protein VJZ25_09185 [Gemmatimonadaceae bacterium]|nr:hypothetical protein [Gemmatimonadaceae bacterium]
MYRSSYRGSILAWALVALLVAACAPAPDAAPGASPTVAASQPGVLASTPLPISVTEAKYGLLSVRTVPGARCQADLRITAGTYGDVPPGALPGTTAGLDGFATWTYSAPRVPSGTAGYTVRCQGDAASEVKTGNFTIPTHPIVASSLTVRVTTDLPPHERIDPDPSLVPLRDATLARIKATLAAEWKSATRGMGSLLVDDQSPDITMFVIAGRGTSVHRTWPGDDSQDILIYVSDESGCRDTPPFSCPRNVENNVAVALHELGHIWCCRGPDANDGGHWATKEPSPGLYGVDKYGLMNEPVLCTIFGSIVSCPNRFSDREMVALGFSNFPPAAPDPCITQSLSLRSQINALQAQMRANELTLENLAAQIRAIESRYPGGIPQPTYNTYLALRSEYLTLYDEYSQRFERHRALIAQINALPCDSS